MNKFSEINYKILQIDVKYLLKFNYIKMHRNKISVIEDFTLQESYLKVV